MNNKDKKNLIKTFKDAEQFILLTEDDCAICGDTPTLLTMYVHLTEQMLGCKFVDEEILERAYKLGISSDEERLKIMSETIGDNLKDLKNDIEEAIDNDK